MLVVPDEQKQLFDEGLIQGIEVANGHGYSEETFRVALDHDLVILGTSDIHGLIDYDYDLDAGEHRTVTLVLAREKSAEAIREALIGGRPPPCSWGTSSAGSHRCAPSSPAR